MQEDKTTYRKRRSIFTFDGKFVDSFTFCFLSIQRKMSRFTFCFLSLFTILTRLDLALQANDLADSKSKVIDEISAAIWQIFWIFISLSVLLFWQDKTWFGLASQWCNRLEILDNFDTCESRFRFKHFFVSVVILAAHCTAQWARQFCKKMLCTVVVLRAKNSFKKLGFLLYQWYKRQLFRQKLLIVNIYFF